MTSETKEYKTKEYKPKDPTIPAPPMAPPDEEPTPPHFSMALAKIQEFSLGLEPRDMAEMFKLASIVAESGLYGCKSAPDAVVRIMTGRSLGFPAMTSLRALYSFDGKVAPYAETKEVLTRRYPTVEYIRQASSTDDECTYVGKRFGDPTVFTAKWTTERALKAGLLDRGKDEAAKAKNNWNRFPAQMLRARARGEICSIVEPAAALGLPTIEELRDSGATDFDPETGEIFDRPTVARGPSAAASVTSKVRDVGAEARAFVSEIASVVEDTQAGRESLIKRIAEAKFPEPYRTEVRDAYAKRFPVRQAESKPAASKREPGEDG